jgi:hypothetical protein
VRERERERERHIYGSDSRVITRQRWMVEGDRRCNEDDEDVEEDDDGEGEEAM